MDRKNLLKPLIYLIFFILAVNFLGNKFYWHYSIWYFDMIMHLLGGFWIGLAFFYILPFKDISLNLISKILFFVCLVGIGWEVFEILVNDIIAQNPFNYLDTFSDLLFDISGGALSILYIFKKVIFEKKNEVQ